MYLILILIKKQGISMDHVDVSVFYVDIVLFRAYAICSLSD